MRIYQKPLLADAAQKFEAVLRESCRLVDRKISVTSKFDEGFVKATAQASEAALKSCFEVQRRLNALENFHDKQIKCLERLSRSGVTDRRTSTAIVAEMT